MTKKVSVFVPLLLVVVADRRHIITCERNQVDGCCVCRNNCTYCGGGIEDNYPPAGIAAAIFLFPIGIALCCILKERQCVKCNRTCA